MRLTPVLAEEIAYKLAILADESDLQDDYGLTQEQADTLRDSVPSPRSCPVEWAVPAWAVKAVQGELAAHAVIVRDCADTASEYGLKGQAVAGYTLANRLARLDIHPIERL